MSRREMKDHLPSRCQSSAASVSLQIWKVWSENCRWRVTMAEGCSHLKTLEGRMKLPPRALEDVLKPPRPRGEGERRRWALGSPPRQRRRASTLPRFGLVAPW